jgi:hypothetical protein
MNARSLMLAAVLSLSSFTVGAVLAAPAALAEEGCPNIAARQGPSAALPDCRAYEQVTPVSKGDATDMFPSIREGSEFGTEDVGYVAENGERMMLTTEASFSGGDTRHSSYVFSRGPSGWTTTTLSQNPQGGVGVVLAAVFDPKDLSEVGVEDTTSPDIPGQPEPLANKHPQVSYVGPPGGPYTTIQVRPEIEEGGNAQHAMFGASEDLSHIILQAFNHELAPGATGQDEASFALYESYGGHLRLVNVASNGTLLNPCGAALGNGEDGEGKGFSHGAVSSDGSRVIFTSPEPDLSVEQRRLSGLSYAGCWNKETGENPPELYIRVNGTSTVEISVPNNNAPHDPDGPQPAVYEGASADGSKIFFITKAELTADDTTHAAELYEYDAEAPEGERLIRVSRGESGTAEGGVQYVGAVSGDGSTVYFGASGKLTESAPEGGGLYRYDTATGKTTFITPGASYPAVPYNGISPGWTHYLIPNSPAEQNRAEANWNTTDNGQYLLFPSNEPLTGYENHGYLELFRYSAADNSVVCVSCAAGAAAPTDNSTIDLSMGDLDAPAIGPKPALSENGSYVFFETTNALVPQTTNRTLHVYEWHDGKISLISTPDDPGNAYFLGASADGSNVFFGTHAQLAASDTDVAGDVYDARIDGGFAGLTPSQCTGTGCQGVPAAPPIFATPASVTFEGVGNFPAGTVAPVEQKTVKPNTSSKAQKLARALKACKRDRAKRRRTRCEAGARARYGTAHKSNLPTIKPGRGN